METPSHFTMMAFTYNLFISPLFDLISTMVTSCIYDRTYNASFHQKRDSITDIIRGTSKEKLCNDLGLETFEKKRWKLLLFKIFWYKCPKYLFNVIPTSMGTCNTRNTNYIPLFKLKHNFFQNSFFLSAVIKWNKLDLNIHKVWISSRKHFWISYVLLEALLSTALIPKELSY